MENILIKYVRDEENNPVGCIMAFGSDDLSWSLCNPNDKFDKRKAKQIAISRFKHFKDKEGWDKKLDSKFWENNFFRYNFYLGKNPNLYRRKLNWELAEQGERSRRYFK